MRSKLVARFTARSQLV